MSAFGSGELSCWLLDPVSPSCGLTADNSISFLVLSSFDFFFLFFVLSCLAVEFFFWGGGDGKVVLLWL